MKLSIIVPVYNVKDYLDKCLESLINISYIDYEVILINDGSTDCSDNICESYQSKFPHIIRYFSKKNSGLSDTRNMGIKYSKGDYVCFVDSDDYIDSAKLIKLWKIIEQKKPDITYFGFYCESKNYQIIKYPFKSNKNMFFDSLNFMKNELNCRNLPVAACFGIYKKELITDNNLYFKSGILHEDERWTPEMLLKSHTIYTSDIVIYHYVQRENSITHKKDRTKNAIDLISTCNYLDSLDITDFQLKRLFRNRQAMVYMRATVIGKLFKKKNAISRSYPLMHSYKIFDIIKSIIYLFSPRFYCFIARRKDD